MPAVTAGCSGADEISIGTVQISEFFISPLGSDQAPGTREEPWLTFAAATARLGPGSFLTLLSGVYEAETTGRLALACGTKIANGQPYNRITVRADKERQAFLRGDGKAPPIVMTGCSHWVLEGLHAESQDVTGAPGTPEAGSVVVLEAGNDDIELKRLLLARPNRTLHSHVLRIDRSTNITVEESELYDFHHNGFEVSRSSGVILRRNYVNARMTPDLLGVGAYVSPFPDTGDIGFLLEETRFAIVENNIVEGLQDGFAIVGRYQLIPSDNPTPVASTPIEGNRLLGNVALGLTGSGFLLESRCLPQNNPCLDRTRIVTDTELVDNVVVGGRAGVTSNGAVKTRISQLTAVNTDYGVNLGRDEENAGVAGSSSTENALASGFTTAGFVSANEADWRFDHCAAFGVGPAFVPNDARVISPLTADPALGACLVFLPLGSPLARAGVNQRPIGAQVLNRYVKGVLTTERLWNPATGVFTCGEMISGVNDDITQSCLSVHQRLHIGRVAGCPLP